MKIVLTGTSGFIGREVLDQILKQTAITSIIILSRRPLPEIEALDSKIKVLVLENFAAVYPENVVNEIAGAKACIWTLGGSATNPTPEDKAYEVEVEYPLMAAEQMLLANQAKSSDAESKITFLFVSGILSVQDQSKKLMFQEKGRKMRGLTETKLLDLAAAKPNDLETVIVKCGYVLKKDTSVPDVLAGLSRSIKVDELAASMIDVAFRGSQKGSGILPNGELRTRGKAALRN